MQIKFSDTLKMAYLCGFFALNVNALGMESTQTKNYMKGRIKMSNVPLFQQITSLKRTLEKFSRNTDKQTYKYDQLTLQALLEDVESDTTIASEYEQWKITIGENDHPQERITYDIQDINHKLIDLIAQIQNAEPAPNRTNLENGFYLHPEVNERIFSDFNMEEIVYMIYLCKEASDIQSQVSDSTLTFVPILSLKRLKEKYRFGFGWDKVTCDKIGVFIV